MKTYFCVLLFCVALPTWGREQILKNPVNPPKRKACTTGNAVKYLDANNAKAGLFNTGGLFFKDQETYFIPANTTKSPLYAAGIWIGGKNTANELRFAGSMYRAWEFWPGPLDANGNPPADCSLYDRIYKVTKAEVAQYELNLKTTTDLANWPVHLGAPVRDGDGIKGNYNLAAGDRPAFPGDNAQGIGGAKQMIWWVMNDVGGTRFVVGRTPAIGMEVQVTAYAFDGSTILNNTTFYKFVLNYKGAGLFKDAYFGIFADPNLGDAGDDYIGVDTTLNLGFVWNADNNDGDGQTFTYGTAPPAFGFDILKGIQTDVDGDGDLEEQNLSGFTHFRTGGGCDFCDPSTAAQKYNYLKALSNNGTPFRVGGSGFSDNPAMPTTKFVFPGAVTASGAYWAENANHPSGGINQADERWFIMSVGPFKINSGEAKNLSMAALFAQGVDHIDSVAKLKLASQSVQTFFNNYPTVANDAETPNQFSIQQNFPNPFRSQTTIPYTLTNAQNASFAVYNILGQEVVFLDEGYKMAGKHQISANLAHLPNGVYFAKVLLNGNPQETIRLSLLK
jgi:Secretion system C-terminal sorting domain